MIGPVPVPFTLSLLLISITPTGFVSATVNMNHLSVYEAIFGLIGPDTTCRSYYFLVKNGRDNVYIN